METLLAFIIVTVLIVIAYALLWKDIVTLLRVKGERDRTAEGLLPALITLIFIGLIAAALVIRG